MENSQLAVRQNGKSMALAVDSIPAMVEKYKPILKELIVNGEKLSDDQIVGRATFAATYGLDPISEVNTITGKDGKTMAHSMHINGYRRLCQEQVGSAEIQLDFVEIPPETLKKFPGALIGYECRLRDGVTYTAWQKRVTEIGKSLREATGGAVSVKDILEIAGQPPIFTGVGMVYQGELNEWKDRNFNPIERAKKRAEVNARHKRFPTNAPVFEGNDNAPTILTEDPVDGEYTDRSNRMPVSRMSEAEILGQITDERPVKGPYTREDAVRDVQQAETAAETQEGDWKELVEDQQPVAETEVQPAKMSLETAENIIGSDKKRYGDCTDEELSGKLIGLNKQLSKNGLAQEVRDEYKMKVDAINIILANRTH